MTRVEKFRQYREEIANMKVEENTLKKTAALKINEITNSKASSRLAYDEVMSAYYLYNSDEKKEKNPFGFRLKLSQFLYVLLAIIVIFTLLVLVIKGAKNL